jgi:hypothetical protein
MPIPASLFLPLVLSDYFELHRAAWRNDTQLKIKIRHRVTLGSPVFDLCPMHKGLYYNVYNSGFLLSI